MLTCWPSAVTLSGYWPGEVLPACVRSGLLTVSNCDMGMAVERTWYWMSAFFWLSESELSVPEASEVKALSVGANTVMPLPKLLLSWLSICAATPVDLSSRMKVLNCPALASTPVMFVVPAAGAGAAGVVGVVGAAGATAGPCADAAIATDRRSTSLCMAAMVLTRCDNASDPS
uniref:Uncharacterized protein n=1 Tax=Triticum urartu TaxID=4572 RepID=A0A8R7PQ09_TRIUA